MALEKTFYPRKLSSAEITPDGNTCNVVGMVIPPFAKLTRYWVTATTTSHNAHNVYSHQPYSVRGMYVPMDNATEQVTGGTDQTLDELQRRYAPEESYDASDETAEWADGDDDGMEQHVDIAGHEEPISSWAKSHQFFRHERMLGLPQNAVSTESGKITYIDKFKRRGRFKQPTQLQNAKFVVVTATTDSPQMSDDVGDVVWGNTGTVGKLTEWLQNLAVDPDWQLSTGLDTLDNAEYDGYKPQEYFGYGFFNDGQSFNQETSLSIMLQLTMELKVYSPDAERRITFA